MSCPLLSPPIASRDSLCRSSRTVIETHVRVRAQSASIQPRRGCRRTRDRSEILRSCAGGVSQKNSAHPGVPGTLFGRRARFRSEERRVGKECRGGGGGCDQESKEMRDV